MSGTRAIVVPKSSTSRALPTGYAGCIAWGDATLLLDLVNGDPVPNWPHPSDNTQRRPAAQVIDYGHPDRAPTYRAADINGKPAVKFASAALSGLVVPGSGNEAFANATTDGAANFYTSGVAGVTFVAVVQPIALPPAGGDALSLLCYVAPRMLIALDHTGVWIVQARRQVEAWVVGNNAAAAVGTPQLLHFAADYRNGVARLWVNGALTTTLNPLTSAGLTDSTSSPSITLGAFNDASDPWDGLIGYWGVWRRYYDKAAFAGLLPNVAAKFLLPYA